MSREQDYARPRPRIETLVDLIFGLSLSIGAVALITASPPSSTSEINGRIIAFLFTASFIITTWMVYTYQMSVLPLETNFVIYLNVILLILVAIIPFLLFNVEFTNPTLNPADSSNIRDYSSSLFSIDLTAILTILATFSHVLSIEEKQHVSADYAANFRRSRNVQAILAIIMIISLLPLFWTLTIDTVPLRLDVWIIPVIVYWVRRSRQTSSEGEKSRSIRTKPRSSCSSVGGNRLGIEITGKS